MLIVSDEAADFSKRYSMRGLNVRSISHAKVAGLVNSGGDYFDDFEVAIVHMVATSLNPIDTVRSIRKASDIPVMCVSCSSRVSECVVVLELGADGYVREPIDELEFSARVRALIRRPTLVGHEKLGQTLVVDDVELYLGEKTAFRSGERLPLTGVEFDILHLLVKSIGCLVTRDEMSRAVFGSRTTIRNRSIDVHMSSLRKKLGKRPTGDERIRTIRGSGYVYTSLR